ncbi:NUDIX hydrolase [Roseibium sp. MMSF_3544]|uniref:NUDIX hydrolase n=1 Tax=unclassified Roseibium TaxID=2629323 RepID=UPI00273E2387|nr:NUDIX hydrolase [Roseibium sp. MMSF_3544]
MSFAKAIKAHDASWLHGIKGLFLKQNRLQIAALCVRPGERENEILLVSTRDTGRLILPKGWPEKKKQAFETAVIEAYEEAGVIGKADTRPIGTFRSFKGLDDGSRLPTKVLVFRLQFEKQLKKFPEVGQRKQIWLPLSEAIASVDEPALGRFLHRHRAKIG